MTHTEFVVNVGVLDRDISDDDVSGQEPLKHVETNVSLPANLHRRTSSDIQSVEGGIDQVFFNLVEIDFVLCAKGPNDEGSHYCYSLSSKTARSGRGKNVRSSLLSPAPRPL